MVGRGLQLVGKGLGLLIHVLVLLQVCGTLKLLMPVLVGGKPRKLVVVCGKCVVGVMSVESVRLPMVIMSMLMGRSRASTHRQLYPRRGGVLHLRPVWNTVC
jgi:hypothetical protein